MMSLLPTLAVLETVIFVPYKHKTRFQEQLELEEEERWLNLSSIEFDHQFLELLSFEAFMLFYNLSNERYHPKTPLVRRERLDPLVHLSYLRFQRREEALLS